MTNRPLGTGFITEAVQKLFANRGHNLTSARWDDFNRPDSQLSLSNGGLLPSGHTYNLGFASPATSPALVIANGKLRLNSDGASYLWTTGARHIAGHSIEYYFEPGTTVGSSVGLICSKLTGPNPTGASGVATNAVHCAFGVHTWAIGIFNSSTFTVIQNGTYVSDLTADGQTRYRASVRRIGPDRIQLDLPAPDAITGKTSILIRDRRIPQWWGATSLIEHFQPTGTYATDPRPVITGWSVDGPEPRSMPLDPPTGLSGIPGAIPLTYAALAVTANVTRYTPIEVNDPISVTGAVAEVTVAGSAGTKMRAAIMEADENWQPTRLLLDLGEVATDAVAVVPWAVGTPLTLSRGRYMIATRFSGTPTMRYSAYASPGAPDVKATLGATPYVQSLQASETYGAFADPPTAWTTAQASAIIGWMGNVFLTWTGI